MFSNRNFICRTRLSVASGTKCTHVTEPITKDKIASMKTEIAESLRMGAGEIVSKRMIKIMASKGKSGTKEITTKRPKSRTRSL